MSAAVRRGSDVDVVKTLAPLRDNPAGRLDVRILQVRQGDRRVDVRQHVISDGFVGYTRRGICLSSEEWRALLEQRDAIEAALDGGPVASASSSPGRRPRERATAAATS
jgi:hypothetical protein